MAQASRAITRMAACAFLAGLLGVACEDLPAADDPRELIPDAQLSLDADVRQCQGTAIDCPLRGECTAGCTTSLGCVSDNVELCAGATSVTACLEQSIDCRWAGTNCYLGSDACAERFTSQTCQLYREEASIPCTWRDRCTGFPESCAGTEAECNQNVGCNFI